MFSFIYLKKCYHSTLIYKSQNEVLHLDTRIVTEEFFKID